MKPIRFSEEVLAALEKSKALRIRAGTGTHRFIGIWFVVVGAVLSSDPGALSQLAGTESFSATLEERSNWGKPKLRSVLCRLKVRASAMQSIEPISRGTARRVRSSTPKTSARQNPRLRQQN